MRKLVAKDHREAYDLWATHSSDPALMANRDAETTRRKLARLAASLPLERESRVLDVGPGDGQLFRLIADRVAACWGVDPSPSAVARLTHSFRDVPNVKFIIGTSAMIPVRDGCFDVVVVNSVLHSLPGRDDIERSLRELTRVCRLDGVVFVGELPFRSELDRGIVPHMLRKLREFGPRSYLRLLIDVYLRPVLRGEPVVFYPASNLHVSERDLRSMCRPLGVAVEARRHCELARPSMTRNDYLLRRVGLTRDTEVCG